MDIALASIMLSHTQSANDIGTAVLKKSLDAVEQSGDNLIKMMEQSVASNLGQTIDVKL